MKDILAWIDQLAPFDTQESFDNAGFQVGSPEAVVSGILLCLDVTEQVIQEAENLGANLIISHHPLIFSSLRAINTQDHVQGLVASLLRKQLHLISGHTNLDQSELYSASAILAQMLGLSNIRREGAYVFLGDFPQALSAEQVHTLLANKLDSPVRMYTGADAEIQDKQIVTLGLAGGGYSEGIAEARKSGAQAYLTGEVKHHHGVEAAALGMVLYDGGHLATESIMLAPLASGLQKSMDALQYTVQVFVSDRSPYRLR